MGCTFGVVNVASPRLYAKGYDLRSVTGYRGNKKDSGDAAVYLEFFVVVLITL